MNQLFLGDLENMSEEELREHIIYSYEANKNEVNKYDILIAYESVGDYGCDSSSFFLLRNTENGKLYENYGNHCSCYGFEGQFEPEETSVEYLQSEHFSFYCGGYDSNKKENKAMILEYISKLN